MPVYLRYLAFAALLTLSTQARAGSLTIDIEGFETGQGLARIVLFNSQAGYEGQTPPFRIAHAPVQQGRARWFASDLPAGDYAVIAHHDSNANDALDRPYLSLPLEPYGFSNNAFRTFGVPAFERVRFKLDSAPVTQTIAIQYNPIAAMLLSVKPFGNLIFLTLALATPLLAGLLCRWVSPWTPDARLLGRIGLSLLLLVTSSAHFTKPEAMMLMLPGWLPARLLLIYATGVLEVLLAMALWIKGYVRQAGWAIALMLVVFLAANIYAAMRSVPFGGSEMGPSYLYARVPFQAFLIGWTLWSTRSAHS